MLEFWMDFPSWVRLLIAFIVLVIGGLMCWFITARLGIIIVGFGFAMLIFGGKDDSEKKGYHF